MTYLEFIDLPYHKQLMACSLAYCRNNNINTMLGKKFSSRFWLIYNYIKTPKNKFDRQAMKNIYRWLVDKGEKCQLWELRQKSADYVAKLNEQESKKKNEELHIEEYGELDLESFLNG